MLYLQLSILELVGFQRIHLYHLREGENNMHYIIACIFYQIKLLTLLRAYSVISSIVTWLLWTLHQMFIIPGVPLSPIIDRQGSKQDRKLCHLIYCYMVQVAKLGLNWCPLIQYLVLNLFIFSNTQRECNCTCIHE